MEKKIKELLADAAFMEKVKACKDFDELANLFSDEGVVVSAEDLKKAQKISENGEELDEEALEAVSGGGVFLGALLIWTGVCGAIGAIHGFRDGVNKHC